MYIAIIIFVVILLLVILVVINFADSDVPKLARLLVSSLIIIILATGVYYLISPGSILTFIPAENTPADIAGTSKDTTTVISKDIVPTETLKEVIPKDTIISLAAEPSEKERTETVSQTVTSTEIQKEATPKNIVVSTTIKPTDTKRTETGIPTVASAEKPMPSDTLSTSLAATETLIPKKQTINACTAWVIMSNKPTKVTYRNCCTNTDTTISVNGSLGVCAAYGFTPTGSGVTLLSNGSCKCN